MVCTNEADEAREFIEFSFSLELHSSYQFKSLSYTV